METPTVDESEIRKRLLAEVREKFKIIDNAYADDDSDEFKAGYESCSKWINWVLTELEKAK